MSNFIRYSDSAVVRKSIVVIIYKQKGDVGVWFSMSPDPDMENDFYVSPNYVDAFLSAFGLTPSDLEVS